MRSPSLYSHFESKNAIYDGMFGQAWEQVLELQRATPLPKSPRRRLLALAEQFFDFSVADLVRYQLINQRTIPDFRPTNEAYAPSLESMAVFRQALAEIGITAQADIDLNTGIVSGFVDQQLANDPGGDRWRSQLPRVIDMYADAVGLPGPRLRRTR
jgi:AcrR family transcriptional regulator